MEHNRREKGLLERKIGEKQTDPLKELMLGPTYPINCMYIHVGAFYKNKVTAAYTYV